MSRYEKQPNQQANPDLDPVYAAGYRDALTAISRELHAYMLSEFRKNSYGQFVRGIYLCAKQVDNQLILFEYTRASKSNLTEFNPLLDSNSWEARRNSR